jgi:hypothetical protein
MKQNRLNGGWQGGVPNFRRVGVYTIAGWVTLSVAAENVVPDLRISISLGRGKFHGSCYRQSGRPADRAQLRRLLGQLEA